MKSFFCEHSIFDKYLRAPAYLSHDKASAVEKRIGKSMLTIFIFMYRLNQILNKKAIWWNFRILPSFMLCFFLAFSSMHISVGYGFFSITRSKICVTGQKTANQVPTTHSQEMGRGTNALKRWERNCSGFCTFQMLVYGEV